MHARSLHGPILVLLLVFASLVPTASALQHRQPHVFRLQREACYVIGNLSRIDFHRGRQAMAEAARRHEDAVANKGTCRHTNYDDALAIFRKYFHDPEDYSLLTAQFDFLVGHLLEDAPVGVLGGEGSAVVEQDRRGLSPLGPCQDRLRQVSHTLHVWKNLLFGVSVVVTSNDPCTKHLSEAPMIKEALHFPAPDISSPIMDTCAEAVAFPQCVKKRVAEKATDVKPHIETDSFADEDDEF